MPAWSSKKSFRELSYYSEVAAFLVFDLIYEKRIILPI